MYLSKTMYEKIKANIFGLAIGDAFGVPFESLQRTEVKKRISSKMVGFGTHNQPPGTWSDDTALTLGLMNGHNRSKIACWLLVEILINIIEGNQKKNAIDSAYKSVGNWIKASEIKSEWSKFHRCHSILKSSFYR